MAWKRESSFKRRYNAQLVDNIVGFADDLGSVETTVGNAEASFSTMADTIKTLVEIGVLTRQQALGRLAIFARVGAQVAVSHGDEADDVATWFSNNADVFEAGARSEATDQDFNVSANQ